MRDWPSSSLLSLGGPQEGDGAPLPEQWGVAGARTTACAALLSWRDRRRQRQRRGGAELAEEHMVTEPIVNLGAARLMMELGDDGARGARAGGV